MSAVSLPLPSSAAFFAKLIPSILADLRRIASRSRGETTVEDLQTEAWLVAEELSQDREPRPDAEDKGFHQQILGRLYNRFVKFADWPRTSPRCSTACQSVAGFIPRCALSAIAVSGAKIRLADRNQAKLFPRAHVPLRRL